jgi:hypothetical protein
MQLFDVAVETAMAVEDQISKLPPRALALCARCAWVKPDPRSNLEWFRNRCSAAYVKSSGRLVTNENYGKATGQIKKCTEWVT